MDLLDRTCGRVPLHPGWISRVTWLTWVAETVDLATHVRNG